MSKNDKKRIQRNMRIQEIIKNNGGSIRLSECIKIAKGLEEFAGKTRVTITNCIMLAEYTGYIVAKRSQAPRQTILHYYGEIGENKCPKTDLPTPQSHRRKEMNEEAIRKETQRIAKALQNWIAVKIPDKQPVRL